MDTSLPPLDANAMNDPDPEEELGEFLPTKFLSKKSGDYKKQFKDYLRRILQFFVKEDDIDKLLSEKSSIVKSGQYGFKVNVLGPFYIFHRAFRSKYSSSLNLEHLESLGDDVLNTYVNMYLSGRFPYIEEVGLKDDMKKYYTNNENIAKYARALGFEDWFYKLNDGVPKGTKVVADVFEAFVGAIAYAGENFVGQHWGFIYAQRFIYMLYGSTKIVKINEAVKDVSVFNVRSRLFNDFVGGLSETQKKELVLKKSKNIVNGETTISLSLESSQLSKFFPDKLSDKIVVVRATGSDPYPKAANEKAFTQLVEKIGLTKKLIDNNRREKFESNPAFLPYIEQLTNYNNENKTNYQFSRIDRNVERGVFAVTIYGTKQYKVGDIKIKYKETVAIGSAPILSDKDSKGKDNPKITTLSNAIDALKNANKQQKHYITVVDDSVKEAMFE